MKTTVTWSAFPTLIALLIPCQADALVLGDIDLHSYLNQPLDASIKVLPEQAVRLNEVHVGLATRRDFEKAGIEQRPLPGVIGFKVTEGADGIPVIRLSSREPIKEPLLDFIIEVSWPNGHLLREYTVFLDPSTDTREAAAATISPGAGDSGETAAAGGAASQQAMAKRAPAQPIATRSITPRLSRDGYGPTMRPDTLWPIAEAVRPDASVSIPQVMLALVRKNPEAFYDENVNELKAGYMLRIPDKAMINQVSETDAQRKVKRQYRRWVQSRQGARPPAQSIPASNRQGGQTRAAPGASPDPVEAAADAGKPAANLARAD